jgi:hypothetical protein
MAASTFAALFLAHVIADYLLQTTWLVENKRRPMVIGLHIGAVFMVLPLLTLSFSPWFIALAAMHLAIDLSKTHLMRPGLPAYVADQALHLVSIGLVVALAPGIWAESPLSGSAWLPQVYLILAMILFTARGGQYAVAALFPADSGSDSRGVRIGWFERSALSAAVAAGAPLVFLTVLTAKAGHVAWAIGNRAGPGRDRLIRGSALSLTWGLTCAAALWVLLPTLG